MSLIQLAGLDFNTDDPTLTVTFWREEGSEDLKIETSPDGGDALKSHFARALSEQAFMAMQPGTKYALTMSFDAGCKAEASPGGDPHDQQVLATLRENARRAFVEPLELLGETLRRLPTAEQFRDGITAASRQDFMRAALEGHYSLLGVGKRAVKVVCACGSDHDVDENVRAKVVDFQVLESGLGAILDLAIPVRKQPIGVIEIPSTLRFHDPFFNLVGEIFSRAAMRVMEEIEAQQLTSLQDTFNQAADAIATNLG